jgi:Tol biopolymer transport system component
VSTPERSEPIAPIQARSFGIDLSTGDAHAYPADQNSGLDATSISPDGTRVVGYQPETGQLMLADFGDPGSLRPLGAPLQVAPDRPVAWSPDGAHIAYGNVVGGAGFQAFALPIAGGDPVQLTDFEEGLWNGAFSWGR